MRTWESWTQAARKPERLALGLMSGMSRDGVDLALIRVAGLGDAPRDVTLVGATTVAYPPPLRARLATLPRARVEDVAALDADLAEFWAEQVLTSLSQWGCDPGAVDVLGSHGQTAFHAPRAEGRAAVTLQIGQADVLAERTGIATVGDFRTRDVAAGGEGAPLIPLADFLLFAQADETVACHNLGSIANVTVCPRTGSPHARAGILAFDTAPANALIDAFASDVRDDGCDRDGTISARGEVIDDLLLAMYTKRARWLRQPPPKSAGFDTFGAALADELRADWPDVAPHDRVRTAVAFTAHTLRDAYEWHVLPGHDDLRRVHLSGGGCHNPTLVQDIQARFADLDLTLAPLEAAWIDAKEAVGFALLADETLQGRPGNVPAATGAAHARVLGKVSLP